jgi:hypothetical protein
MTLLIAFKLLRKQGPRPKIKMKILRWMGNSLTFLKNQRINIEKVFQRQIKVTDLEDTGVDLLLFRIDQLRKKSTSRAVNGLNGKLV